MTRSEREQLIERWSRGEMTPSEEHDFFIEVAANRELRSELKAYRIVDEALRKDSAADVSTYTSLRSGMLTMIATDRMGNGQSAGRSPMPDRPTDQGSRRSSFARRFGAAGLVAAVILVGFFLSSRRADQQMPDLPIIPYQRLHIHSAAPRTTIDTLPATPVEVAPKLENRSSDQPSAVIASRPRRPAPQQPSHVETPQSVEEHGGSSDAVSVPEKVEESRERARRDSLKIQLLIQAPKRK